MSLDITLTEDKSTLVQVMAWCRQAPSHDLNQCWPRSMAGPRLYDITRPQWVNTLMPRWNGRHFRLILLHEKCWILIQIYLKYILIGPVNNNPTLVQIMAWQWTGDEPLSEPMMIQFTDAYIPTQPQWVKAPFPYLYETKFGITFSADGQSHYGTRPSAGTVLTTQN